MPGPRRHLLVWPEAGVEMALRQVPAGWFRMGSLGGEDEEQPVHLVVIPQSFWIGETPVTQAQFALWTHALGIRHRFRSDGRPDHPAENVSWTQAIAFCAWLARTAGNQFPPEAGLACLPTEAEWEHACRSGTSTDYHTGDGESAMARAGWAGEDRETGATHPVGEKAPNAFGLFDMHGNVWEWCHDAWERQAYQRRADGARAPGSSARLDDWSGEVGAMLEDSAVRALRGGSWNDPAARCRSASRHRFRAFVFGSTIGFRVCLVQAPKRA